jgi:hypothetical protein
MFGKNYHGVFWNQNITSFLFYRTTSPKYGKRKTVCCNVLILIHFKMNKGTLDVRFYRTDNGTEPVRDWLRALAPIDRKKIGEDIKTVQY